VTATRPRSRRPRSRARRVLGLFLAAVVVLLLGAAGQYARPVPALAAVPLLGPTIAVDGPAPTLPWPRVGAAAVGTTELGLLATYGGDQPRPTASTAKIMTALLVLADHPLAVGEAGPVVTVSAQDVADYRREASEGQSVMLVADREQLSEYQLLQALLLPSANNVAGLLARWDAGSIEAFVDRLNAKAAAMGMTHTHFADASGYSPQTVSTPADLVIAAEAAMADPVFAQIVGQPQARLPVAGTVYNVNAVLGRDGIIGVKTGSTPEAGSCFVFAAKQPVGDQTVTVYGAVMGQELLADAFDDAQRLAAAVGDALRWVRVLTPTEPVAVIRPAWGGEVRIVPADAVTLLGWPGATVQADLAVEPLQAPLPAHSRVGTLTVRLGPTTRQVDLYTDSPLEAPSLRWRLTRGP